MKVRYIEGEKEKSPVQHLLGAIEEQGVPDGMEEAFNAAKDHAEKSGQTWNKHAGDLKPGEIGVDADDKYYLGCEGSGAYELDGKTRWMPESGPAVQLLDCDELVLLGKGKDLPEPEEKEEEKGDSGLVEAVKDLLSTIATRFEKHGASRLEEAHDKVKKLLG